MKFKIQFLTIVSMLLLGTTAMQAQRGDWGGSPQERAEKQTETMTEKLSLSGKQAQKVKEINLKYADKMTQAREANADGDWSAMRETMMKLRQEQNEELKTVLTAEQFDTWTKYQDEQRNQRSGRGEKLEKDGKSDKKAPKDKKS